MSDYKFRIGEQVELVPSLTERLAAGGIYEVVRQLPTNNGELGYHIKSDREPYRRAVRESQLRRLLGPA